MKNGSCSPMGVLGYLKKNGRLVLLGLGVLVGILLIAIGGSFSKEEQPGSESDQSLSDLQAYESALEKELAELCSAVAGVGQVEVLVHLESGTRTQYATAADGKPLTVGTGSSQQALQSTLLSPKVAGVGVVCRGGNRADVQQRLIELISTALDISTGRVFVTGK